MFKLYADKNKLLLQEQEDITSGSMNVYTVHFSFSADWDKLTRIAVFQYGEKKVSAPLDEDGTCQIPREVLYSYGRPLMVGVYGTQDGIVVLPTALVSLGTVLQGVSPEDSPFQNPPEGDDPGQTPASPSEADHDDQWTNTPEGGSASQEIYALEEQVVGRWIDGRPVYRRTYETQAPSTPSQWIAVTSSIPDFDALIAFKGICHASSVAPPFYLIPYSTPSATNSLTPAVSQTGEVVLWAVGNKLSVPCFITLDYTKTTDHPTIELPAALAAAPAQALYKTAPQSSAAVTLDAGIKTGEA